MKKNILPVLMTASLISLAMLPLRAPGAEVAMLFKQDLADMAGKAGQVLTVEFAPGEVSAPHRHNAHTFVYVLEGSVVMQVKGGEAKTLRQDRSFMKTRTISTSGANITEDREPARMWFVAFEATRTARRPAAQSDAVAKPRVSGFLCR